jgi:putative transposase
VESGLRKDRTDEALEVFGRTDRCDPARAGGWGIDCRRLSEARGKQRDFHKWKARYGGLDVSDAKRLKALQDENARLKRLLADAMLDNVGLKELLAKKW